MTPEDVVRGELGAWRRLDIDEIMSYFAIDAVWDNVPIEAVRGFEAIRRAVERYVKRTTSGHIEILNLATAGNVVLTERIDHFSFDGHPIDARVMGAFEVAGDKITAWRDYFDLHPRAAESLRER